jgi:hypothetical protein
VTVLGVDSTSGNVSSPKPRSCGVYSKTSEIGLEIRRLSAQAVSVTGFPVSLRPRLEEFAAPN